MTYKCKKWLKIGEMRDISVRFIKNHKNVGRIVQYAHSIIFLSAFVRNCFLCQDRLIGDVPLWLDAALLIA